MKKSHSKLFISLAKGLNEAIENSKNNHATLKTAKVIIPEFPEFHSNEIKKLRNNLRLTQFTFAKTLGVSTKTIEAWESGRNIPQGPAQRVLYFLKEDKNALKKLNIQIK